MIQVRASLLGAEEGKTAAKPPFFLLLPFLFE
jgi:hypothetical protein